MSISKQSGVSSEIKTFIIDQFKTVDIYGCIHENKDSKYINITDILTSAKSKKLFTNWTSLVGSKKYIETLTKKLGVNIGDIIIHSTRGSKNCIWAHPYIAIEVARWISPDFSIDMNKIILRFITGDVSLIPEIADNAAAASGNVVHAEVMAVPDPKVPAAGVIGMIDPKNMTPEEKRMLEDKWHTLSMSNFKIQCITKDSAPEDERFSVVKFIGKDKRTASLENVLTQLFDLQPNLSRQDFLLHAISRIVRLMNENTTLRIKCNDLVQNNADAKVRLAEIKDLKVAIRCLYEHIDNIKGTATLVNHKRKLLQCRSCGEPYGEKALSRRDLSSIIQCQVRGSNTMFSDHDNEKNMRSFQTLGRLIDTNRRTESSRIISLLSGSLHAMMKMMRYDDLDGDAVPDNMRVPEMWEHIAPYPLTNLHAEYFDAVNVHLDMTDDYGNEEEIVVDKFELLGISKKKIANALSRMPPHKIVLLAMSLQSKLNRDIPLMADNKFDHRAKMVYIYTGDARTSPLVIPNFEADPGIFVQLSTSRVRNAGLTHLTEFGIVYTTENAKEFVGSVERKIRNDMLGSLHWSKVKNRFVIPVQLVDRETTIRSIRMALSEASFSSAMILDRNSQYVAITPKNAIVSA